MGASGRYSWPCAEKRLVPACSCGDYAPGVVITSTGLDRRRTVSRLAFAIGILDLLAVVFLIIFYAVGRGAFGFGNDVANGLVGLLSIALAWLWVSPRTTIWSRVGLVTATVGGTVMIIGSILIIYDITGWYLAGLVSSTGSALIGIWLLVANRMQRYSARLPGRLIMLGMTTAIFMILGWLAVPGVVARIDDPQLAPWFVNAGLLSWMGTYLLYPIWCLWLSRRYGS
jgi:hypothetical protein